MLYLPILTGDAIDLILEKGRVDFPGIFDILQKMAVVIFITAFAQWLMNVCNQNNDSGNPDMNAKHESKRADDRNDTGEKLGKSHQQAIRKLIHVGNDTAHNLAVRMSVNLMRSMTGYRKLL